MLLAELTSRWSHAAGGRHDQPRFLGGIALQDTRPPDGILHGTWTATVRDIDGVLTGTVDVPVAAEPVDFAALLPTDLGPAKRR